MAWEIWLVAALACVFVVRVVLLLRRVKRG